MSHTAELIAVGTNSIATASMLKAGARNAATGENAVLVACRKDGADGLTVEPPLLVRDESGALTAEYRAIYGFPETMEKVEKNTFSEV